MRSLLSVVAVAPLLVAQVPVSAEGVADDLGVMSISLKDVMKPKLGIQGQTQGAGTPNQAGIGGFLPLVVGENSTFFADVLANANFGDYSDFSSIINTEVAGTTISTSSRLGYRWLTSDRSWMFGLNAGYDTRPMKTGPADTGVSVRKYRSPLFEQAAVNIEAVSEKFSFNAYSLIPTGDTFQRLNNFYSGGALNTTGFDAGYKLTEKLATSVGYYYQDGDGNEADGSGVSAGLAYDLSKDVILIADYTYDDSFESRYSAGFKMRFNTGSSQKTKSNEEGLNPVIKSLNSSPEYRTVRVHDRFSLHFNFGAAVDGCVSTVVAGLPLEVALAAAGPEGDAVAAGLPEVECLVGGAVAGF